jgi:hypothetical protein
MLKSVFYLYFAQANPGPAGVEQLQQLLSRIISISVGISFIALTVMLIMAGMRYLSSGGDPKSIQQATQTITWAVFGVFFLVLAWLALLLIEKFTGVPVTKFCLGFQPFCKV